MIKNKKSEMCAKCNQMIEPLKGKSVKQTVVPCDTCVGGKKVEHTFEHIDCSDVKIYEIPKEEIEKKLTDDMFEKDDCEIILENMEQNK